MYLKLAETSPRLPGDSGDKFQNGCVRFSPRRRQGFWQIRNLKVKLRLEKCQYALMSRGLNKVGQAASWRRHRNIYFNILSSAGLRDVAETLAPVIRTRLVSATSPQLMETFHGDISETCWRLEKVSPPKKKLNMFELSREQPSGDPAISPGDVCRRRRAATRGASSRQGSLQANEMGANCLATDMHQPITKVAQRGGLCALPIHCQLLHYMLTIASIFLYNTTSQPYQMAMTLVVIVMSEMYKKVQERKW